MLRVLKTLLPCILIATATAQAQEQAPSEDRAAQVRERMAHIQVRLNLTPEQTEKLKPILQQQITELRNVRDKHSGDTSRRGKVSMAREMKGVQDKYDGSINAILTPEQQKEWRKIKEERKQEMKQKRGR